MLVRRCRWFFLFLLSWITCNLPVIGQTAPWQWQFAVQSTGGVISSEKSTVDATGDILVVGTFKGEVTFAPLAPLISGAHEDIFVAKFAARSGQCLWASRAGGDGYEDGRGIAVTPTGDVLITGNFQVDPARFGTLPELIPVGNADLCVAKLDGQTGAWLWAVGTGSVKRDIGWAVTADQAGNAIVTGEFEGYINFGATQLFPSGGSTDVFLAAFDGTNGQAMWALAAGGNGLDRGLAIAVDAAGEMVVTGQFAEVAVFPSTQLFAQQQEQGAFIAKASGQPVRWQWARALSAEGIISQGLTLDTRGNIFTTGGFQGALHVGTDPDKEAEQTLQSASSQMSDCFLAKLDAQGHFLWATRGGGLDDERGYDVVADPQGDVYTTGFFRGEALFGADMLNTPGTTVYVGKLSGKTGQWLGVTQTHNASLSTEAFGSSLSLRGDGQLVRARL